MRAEELFLDNSEFPERGEGKRDSNIVALSNATPAQKPNQKQPTQIAFDRRELSEILRVYGYRVAEGEWRDYALDFQKERAVFSIFKRTSEMPIYQVEKNPKLARKQGAYSVINAAGMILKRGHELRQVLKVLEPRKHLRVVD